MLSTLFGCSMGVEAKSALLNIKPDVLTKRQHALMLHFLEAAKQTESHALLTTRISFTDVKTRIHRALVNDKLASRLLDRVAAFQKIWESWLMYYCHPTFDTTRLAV